MFQLVWQRIEQHQGQLFWTKSGKEFRYTCSGGAVKPSHTNRQIPRSDFEKVFAMGALSGPGMINDQVQGPAYIWAILNDRRIVPA